MDRTHASPSPSRGSRSRALIRDGRGMFTEREKVELGLKYSEALVERVWGRGGMLSDC